MYWKTEPREISKWTLWVGLSLLAVTGRVLNKGGQRHSGSDPPKIQFQARSDMLALLILP